MFENSAGKDPLDQIRFMADAGFRAFEDNGMMKRPVELQQQMGDLLAKRGMTMGVFVIDGGDNWKVSLATGKPEFTDGVREGLPRRASKWPSACNAKWMTVVPGYFERDLPIGIQTGHVIDALRKGADILAPHDLAMVLEPLSDNPDLFLRHAGRGVRDLPRRSTARRARSCSTCTTCQRNAGPHDRAHRLGVGRDRLLPDRRRAGPQGAGHGRDELPEHLQAHRREGDRPRARSSCSAWSTATSMPGADGERQLIEAYVAADRLLSGAMPG